ncbi:MAG: amylo-alpha-1,6-glucosidase [Phycisphaerales bacterium]
MRAARRSTTPWTRRSGSSRRSPACTPARRTTRCFGSSGPSSRRSCRHVEGTRHGIKVDPVDGLLRAGEPGVQLTWMDAKIGDRVVTPRIGKPVEIAALWYSALRRLATFADRLGMPLGSFAPAQLRDMAERRGAAPRRSGTPRPDVSST